MKQVFKTINSNDVFSVQIGHERCDGTHNIHITMKNGEELEMFGISKKVVNKVEYNLTHPDMSIKFDTRFLSLTESQWLSQNGIRG